MATLRPRKYYSAEAVFLRPLREFENFSTTSSVSGDAQLWNRAPDSREIQGDGGQRELDGHFCQPA